MTSPVHKVTSGVRIIGLVGKAGTGKDTVADHIVSNYPNSFQHALADPLKDALCKLFGVSRVHFDDRKLKEKMHHILETSPREAAQYFGTEIIRTHYGPNFWIKRLTNKLNNRCLGLKTQKGDIAIVSDIRFQNEYDWAIYNGGIILHLTRDAACDTIGIPGHASEQDLIFHTPRRTHKCENNGTILSLYEKVDAILKPLLK